MKKPFVILVSMMVLVLLSLGVYADNTIALNIDKSKIASGVVGISYTSASNKTNKITIEKDSKRYVYSLRHDGVAEYFPLQMGNGEYKITILENIEGSKYAILQKETVNLNMSDPNKVYLASVQNINWAETMKAIKKAKEITKNMKTDAEKIDAIYKYMVATYGYDYELYKNLPTEYIPVIDKTYDTKKGICYDYSSLFASMLRSAGIPVKLVKGYTDNVEGYHAWNEVYNAKTGKWVSVDTTYDSIMRLAKQKYAFEKSLKAYRGVNSY